MPRSRMGEKMPTPPAPLACVAIAMPSEKGATSVTTRSPTTPSPALSFDLHRGAERDRFVGGQGA